MLHKDQDTIPDMPKYRSHKEVWALKLRSVDRTDDTTLTMRPADPEFPDMTFERTSEVAKRCKALVTGDPGYYVAYEDGFESWSPTKAFEEGYDRLHP